MLMTAFVVLTLMSAAIEQSTNADDTALQRLQTIMERPEVTEINNPLSFAITFAKKVWSVIKLIWKALWWDYAFFTGVWSIVKYAIFWPISVGMVFSLLIVMRGVASG